MQCTVRILTTNNTENYYVSEYESKCMLIFDMFAALFDVSLQTVVSLFAIAPIVAVLISCMIEQRAFNGLSRRITVFDTIDGGASYNNVVSINIIVIAFINRDDRIINPVLSCFNGFCILNTFTIEIDLGLTNISTTMQAKAQRIGIIVFDGSFTRIDSITPITTITESENIFTYVLKKHRYKQRQQ